MTVCRHDDPESTCPFAWTEHSEIAQNYGCLPSRFDIIKMRVDHGKTWACHSDPAKPCAGAIRHLKEQGLPYQVIDKVLVTEIDPWHLYCETSNATT